MNVGSENAPLYAETVTGGIALNNAADTPMPNVPCERVLIAAPAGNSVPVYINAAASGTTTGFPIVAGAAPVLFKVDNLNRLGYAYAGAAAQTLRYHVCK